MLFAFGTQQMFAQSSMFQRDNSLSLCEPIDRGRPPDPNPDPNPGGGGGVPVPIGSGVAVLIGCAAAYACVRRKKEE